VIALFWLIAVLLQIHNGAYASEFTTYQDEPAHYVTGLMVRDYIGQGFPSGPLAFARDYYLHYPKVALGHWPPVFYAIQGPWMLVFSESRTSILALMALLAGLFAWLTSVQVAKRLGTIAGLAVGVLILLIPVVQEQTSMVMMECLLGIFSVLAASAFGDYLDSERTKDAVLFGWWTAVTILTKGNGWALVLIPPVALVVSGKLRLLLTRSFWLGASVVAIALPWQLATLKLASDGWNGGSLQRYIPHATKQFNIYLFNAAGPVVAILAVVGIVAYCVLPWMRRSRPTGFWSSMLGLMVATLVFHIAIPAGIEERKMIIGFSALAAFALAGAGVVVKGVGSRFGTTSSPSFSPASSTADANPSASTGWISGIAAALVLAGLLIGAGFGGFQPKQPMRVEATAMSIATDPLYAGTAVLVSGGAQFEGVVISETAMHEHRPNHVFLRATKMLATVSWDGSNYALRYPDPAQMMQQLDSMPIELVAFENRPDVQEFPHHAVLWSAIRADANWELVPGQPDAGNGALLYRRKQAISRITPAQLEQLRDQIGLSTLVSVP
jgi:hypothetical protein